ncbi:type VI secretion system tube protein TssD [Citrobacter koseri]|uniref:type VI secretion system tube protein TssD n=1 Tax=Citrobacter koseri TaxID=545 RepID=UPI003890B9D4|nr:type VI secretion system tube protein Hcp [Citrobacter koseri]
MSGLIYIKIAGEKQGNISAGCGTYESIGNRWQRRHEDEIFSIYLSNTLVNTGKGINLQGLSFGKLIDKSTPLLCNAINNNERLFIEIDLRRINRSGGWERYYYIQLRNAFISGINTSVTNNDLDTEIITVSYEYIQCRHLIANTEFDYLTFQTAYHDLFVPRPAKPAVTRTFKPEPPPPPRITPVYAKSCLQEKGCTDAGSAEEPAENFGQMAIFAQPVVDDCCGYAREATVAPLVLGGLMQMSGKWLPGGMLGAARGTPWVGVLASALYVPSAGEGSARVPGRDEFWYESELRQKARTGNTATTRVRFFWGADVHGKPQVYGVHTGEGTPYENVRVANMLWNKETQRYEFTPAHGVDGPLITWTPEKPQDGDLPAHTGSDVPPIDQATILVTPIPDGKNEYTTPPFPVPDVCDFNDYILVFPAGSGVKPIYVYLSETKTSYTHGHKHYPPKNKPWEEVIKNTQSGPAKFKPEVNIESVDQDVWENGTPTTNGQNWKVKKFDNVQGAYKGKETTWVVTKESQGTIHSHPIGPNEARKLTK